MKKSIQDQINDFARCVPVADFFDPSEISPGFDDPNPSTATLATELQALKIRVAELERAKNE